MKVGVALGSGSARGLHISVYWNICRKEEYTSMLLQGHQSELLSGLLMRAAT